ncbi:LysM peptidoglycan-binding domain-containing protein [Nitriliruptoraceae bacterium ZYF776]|nr:LysM peptidoglycan-binding domain-containing protein [Profundirhabdus halotolerans]
MTRVRPILVLLTFCAALVAALLALHALGDGPLALPDGLGAVGDWAASRDPLVATAALARGLALVAAWYLLATTVLAVVAELVRVGALLRVSRRLAVAPVRRLARAACGATLAVAATFGPVGAAAAAPGPGLAPPGLAPPSVTSVEEGPADDDEDGEVRDEGGRSSGEVEPPANDEDLVTADDAARTPDDRPPPDDAAPGGSAAPALGPPAGTTGTTGTAGTSDDADASDDGPPAGSDDTGGVADDAPERDGDAGRAAPPVLDGDHEVVAGDSFWSIAADDLAVELGRAPTDAEVLPRWQAWIDANADRLAVPGDPDLLFPGQTLVRPDADASVSSGGGR